MTHKSKRHTDSARDRCLYLRIPYFVLRPKFLKDFSNSLHIQGLISKTVPAGTRIRYLGTSLLHSLVDWNFVSNPAMPEFCLQGPVDKYKFIQRKRFPYLLILQL